MIFTYAAKHVPSKQKLTTINHSIAHLQAKLNHDQKLRDSSEKNLKTVEWSEAKLLNKLTKTQQQLNTQQQHLKKLREKIDNTQQAINEQQVHLANQVRSAYLLPQQPLLKLLLDESNANDISRMRMYYYYLTKTELGTIKHLHHNLKKIKHYQTQSQQQWQILQKLQARQQQQHQTLETLKKHRQQIILAINGRISTQSQRLEQLLHHKKILEQTLKQLQAAKMAMRGHQFATLKGALPWPVHGKISHYFGAKIEHSELKWNGIVLEAPANQLVHAIASGKVIFADWLPGYGLLLIINHGDGYMSLYGRNHSLLKKVGEDIEQGEVIASVGNSGGYTNTGLYFEIRFNTKPLNPSEWCHTVS